MVQVSPELSNRLIGEQPCGDPGHVAGTLWRLEKRVEKARLHCNAEAFK